MVRTIKAVKTRERISWRDGVEADATKDVVVAKHAGTPVHAPTRLAAVARLTAVTGMAAPNPVAGPDRLSVRAENVLKELAAELVRTSPPKGRWIPSDSVLRKLTFKHLKTARNCGPRTIDEIITWAAMRGVVIQKPFHAGKSLASMWGDLIARFSSGEFSKVEIAEALERSIRRRNTKIPVALQSILLQILISGS
jgi:hypothetical protein